MTCDLRQQLNIGPGEESPSGTPTFRAEQRGGTLQELSDLLQRTLPSTLDAAPGVMATGWGGDLTTNNSGMMACGRRTGITAWLLCDCGLNWFVSTKGHRKDCWSHSISDLYPGGYCSLRVCAVCVFFHWCVELRRFSVNPGQTMFCQIKQVITSLL